MENNLSKIAIYSLGAIAVFVAFFYFYPAAIFEMEITEGVSKYALDVSLTAVLDNAALPEVVAQENLTGTSLTIKGIFLLVICLVGLPIMIGYRLATIKKIEENTEN